MDVQKVFDNISHVVIVDSVDMLHMPMWMQGLSSRFSKIGHLPHAFAEKLLGPLFRFVVCPRDWCCLLTLFNMTLISVAWRLYDVQSVKFLVCADDLTVLSSYHDLATQVTALNQH